MSDELRNEMLKMAFSSILENERAISAIKTERVTVTTELDLREIEADKAIKTAWEQIEELMKETGEYELEISGEGCNYKIGYNTPRQSVEVDDDAVPQEFCKSKLVPKLKEIKELLDSGTKVNWARFKEGAKKLQYKVVKV